MKDSSKSQALLDAARAELAAKRKIRETRFAATVMGWESEEEARADFPKTVIGWDHPAAGGGTVTRSDAMMAALMAEELAATAAEQQKARRFTYILIGIVLSSAAGFFLASLF